MKNSVIRNNPLGYTAFAIVIFSIVATLAMIAFSEGIRRIDWLDLESMAKGCFGLSILGSVLGWCAVKQPIGKKAAILGTIVVAGFLFQLVRSDGGSQELRPQKLLEVER